MFLIKKKTIFSLQNRKIKIQGKEWASKLFKPTHKT
jgi:hypothetical protein